MLKTVDTYISRKKQYKSILRYYYAHTNVHKKITEKTQARKNRHATFNGHANLNNKLMYTLSLDSFTSVLLN